MNLTAHFLDLMRHHFQLQATALIMDLRFPTLQIGLDTRESIEEHLIRPAQWNLTEINNIGYRPPYFIGRNGRRQDREAVQ